MAFLYDEIYTKPSKDIRYYKKINHEASEFVTTSSASHDRRVLMCDAKNTFFWNDVILTLKSEGVL